VDSAPFDPSVAAVPVRIDPAAQTPAEPEHAALDAAAVTPIDHPNATPPSEPSGWSDPLTGADGPRFWDRILASETARTKRYRRPATVGFVEVTGLERLAIHWGPQVAERVLAGVGRTIAGEVRSSDHVARIGPGRFGVLLAETNEVAAINCFERIRSACEADLGPASVDVVIGFGWASPPPNGDLDQALGLADKRLVADLRQAGG
jgi:diguanylate cyclase (GGDEF)-like protein